MTVICSTDADQEILPRAVVAAVRAAIGPEPAALHEPRLTVADKERVLAALDSGWVSSAGPEVVRFESELASWCGVRHAVATVNGTTALHTALLVSGVRPGDEVLVPALTFVATANAVVHCGATPHFLDSATDTFGIDPEAMEAHLEAVALKTAEGCRNRRTGALIRCVVPMHVFGHPVEMPRLLAVAERWNLTVIEDAAEALGSRLGDRPCGSFGKMAVLSFNGNKLVTTGGGGAILTDDPVIAQRARHLTSTARIEHRWEVRHDMVGYNYRMPNLNAALGLPQLDRLPLLLEQKSRLFARYADAFAGLAGVTLSPTGPAACPNRWLIAALLDTADPSLLGACLAALNDSGYAARPVWTLMHRLPMFATAPRAALPVAENLADRIICLPSSPFLADR
ncbi:LegC family aminotransferase [Thermaurantiacus sp.]